MVLATRNTVDFWKEYSIKTNVYKSIEFLIKLGELTVPIAIRVANQMKIAEQFDGQPKSCEELSEKLSVNKEALQRLLLLLVDVGILEKTDSCLYCLSKLGEILRSDHSIGIREAYLLAQTEIRAWTHLADSLRSGMTGFECAYRESHRSYRSRHLEEDRRMDRAHQAATRLDLLTLSRVYPWAESRTLFDIGGGTGTFLGGILSRFPDMTGALFDLPRMVENPPGILHQFGVAERCQIVGGNFFSDIPHGGDLYVLKAVVGGWDDEACLKILGKLRQAMNVNSKLLIIEPVATEGTEVYKNNSGQLNSFVLYGGDYRSVDDYKQLAMQSFFRFANFISRPTLSIIELVPEAGCET